MSEADRIKEREYWKQSRHNWTALIDIETERLNKLLDDNAPQADIFGCINRINVMAESLTYANKCYVDYSN